MRLFPSAQPESRLPQKLAALLGRLVQLPREWLVAAVAFLFAGSRWSGLFEPAAARRKASQRLKDLKASLDFLVLESRTPVSEQIGTVVGSR
jgi:hypothetical protein